MLNRSDPKFDPCRTPDAISITQSQWVNPSRQLHVQS